MKKIWARVLLVLALVLLYSVSVGHNFLFDEENIILRNPYLKSFANIPQLFQTGFFYLGGGGSSPFLEYYRPLSVLSFMVDYHFWQGDPLGYNLTSVFIHLLLVLAFFEFLCLTIKNIPASFLASLLFAIHPIHTEAINHVSCRSETFAALFLMLALILYLKRLPWWAVACQVAACLAKESAVLIPVFLLAADNVFLEGKWGSRFKRIVPAVIASVGYVLFRRYLCAVPMHLESEPLVFKFERVFSMAPALIQYFSTLFWPPYFQLFGSITFAKGFAGAQTLLTIGLYLIGCASLWDAWKRRSLSFMGLVLLFVGFAPYLQTVAFFPQWAEHFLTVPSLGFYFLWAVVLRAIFQIADKRRRMALLFLPCAWAVFLGARTVERNYLYNDLNRYYTVLSKSQSPYAVHGLHGLAKIRLANKDISGAKRALEEALTKKLNQDVTYAFLAWCEANEKHYEKSLEYFDKAIQINPNVLPYQKDRVNMLMSLGRYNEAFDAYARLIALSPGDYTLYRAAIASLELGGQPERALALGQAALKPFEARRFESAVLHMSLIRLSYRQGWRDVLNNHLDALIKDYLDVPWQGKVAQLLAGQLTVEQFAAGVLPKFKGFEEEAKTLYLVSYVLTKNKRALNALLDSEKPFFEEKAARDPLFGKEWQVAKDAALLSDS